MAPPGLARNAQDPAPGRYQRHRPEHTLLYRIVEQYYPAFLAHLAERGAGLPAFVQREFEAFLQCGRLEHGFLRVRCETCHAERLVAFSCKHRGFCPSCGARRMVETAALLVDEVFHKQPIRQWVLSFPFPLRFLLASRPAVMGQVLGLVYRAIATHLAHKAGLTRRMAHTGAVTLIQRFGSALNLNIHFHMLFLHGVYADGADCKPRFRRVAAPSDAELTHLAQTIAHRVAGWLLRRGFLQADADNSYLTENAVDENALNPLLGASITYRIAVGPHAERKVFTLQTLPAWEVDAFTPGIGQVSGFNLHAGVTAERHERTKIERLCRYIARPALSEQRLSLTSNGYVRYRLKTPYRDGTTHVIFQPLDFLAKLAEGSHGMEAHSMEGMDMYSMQGGKAPPDARSPDYSDRYRYTDMPGMAMSDHSRQGMLLIDQLEVAHDNDGNNSTFIDGQFWYGRDFNKLGVKAEGDYAKGKLEDLRTEALWSHAVSAYWNTQLGMREDFG